MQTVWLFIARYFPTAANEPEFSHIHRKRLTSALKNKLDMSVSVATRHLNHVILMKRSWYDFKCALTVLPSLFGLFLCSGLLQTSNHPRPLHFSDCHYNWSPGHLCAHGNGKWEKPIAGMTEERWSLPPVVVSGTQLPMWHTYIFQLTCACGCAHNVGQPNGIFSAQAAGLMKIDSVYPCQK